MTLLNSDPIVLNDIANDSAKITIEVPQGSVFGPSLFLVYTNDLPNSCDSEILLYADDAVLLCKDKTQDGLKSKSEKEFQKIESWVISNKLTINYTKTNCVFFLKQSKNIDCKNLCIRALNGNITEQNVVKYFGVYEDKQLSWQHHTQSIVKKLTTARGTSSKLRHNAPEMETGLVDRPVGLPVGSRFFDRPVKPVEKPVKFSFLATKIHLSTNRNILIFFH